MLRMFMNHGIDIRREPILVFPTLHYQNGGLDINVDGMTPNVPNLYVAGEAVGGIHGRNRLMGNSAGVRAEMRLIVQPKQCLQS